MVHCYLVQLWELWLNSAMKDVWWCRVGCLVVQGRVLGGARKGVVVCCVGRAMKGLYMQRGREAGEASTKLVTSSFINCWCI